jgi:hypothetical protein
MYVGSDGEEYGPTDLVERFEAGEWRNCLRDAEDGRQLVETDEGELLLLVPFRSLDEREGIE